MLLLEETKSVYLNDYPWELRLCDRDAVIFGSVARNSKFRMWFKCIADPKMICTERIWGGEEGELQEEMDKLGIWQLELRMIGKKSIFVKTTMNI